MINSSNFVLKVIPEFSPFNPERLKWWKEQKRYIFEGKWIGGKWMPPDLYFYSNFWHILVNKDEFSKTKILSRPMLRDLDWEKSYIYQEAKGFSGFVEDTEFTCIRHMQPKNIAVTKELYPRVYEKYKNYIYIPARDYLRKIHTKGSLGKALYENQASNVIDIEARGTGKSYYAASNIAHNFLTDGALDYDDYLENYKNKTYFSSETLVGAYDAKYSKDLLTKVKLGLSVLPGKTKVGNRSYPSPLHKSYSGSWEPSKTIIQEVDVKNGDLWEKVGTRSKIQHRSFKDNPFAGNGTRPNLSYIEEVGFMSNLIDTLGALKECTGDGDIKFGVIWGMGTGGDMEGGSTEQAKEVFYNTEEFDCLSFDDIYEGKGQIGLFIPSHQGFNEFRNSEGILDTDRAKRKNEIRREKAKKATNKKVYTSELQNRPEKPSEAFHSELENILDIPTLEAHLKILESNQDKVETRGIYGNLAIKDDGEIEFIPDTDNKLRPAPFPIKKGKQPAGCVVVWEEPEENPPFGMYIAATDPYDQDQAENTTSVGSTLIMKRYTRDGIIYKRIVAEYSGRPQLARQHHETVRRLLLYYNARDLYENERNTIKMHFEQKHSLHLLVDTPDIIKTQTSDKVVKTGRGRGNKGIGMPPGQQKELIFFVKEYLETPVPNGDGMLYVHTIKSIPLIKECIAFNFSYGNYDRMIAFMLLILLDNQMYNIRVKQKKEKEELDNFFTNYRKHFLANNPNFNYNRQDKTYIQKQNEEGKQPLIPALFK